MLRWNIAASSIPSRRVLRDSNCAGTCRSRRSRRITSRSLGDFGRGTGDHHHGDYYNLTGHAGDPSFRQLLNVRKPYPTDWPSMASTIAYKRPPHPYLPSVISLPQKEGAPEYTRPGQFGARLGLEFDPVFVDGSRETPLKFTAPALQLYGDIGLTVLNAVLGLHLSHSCLDAAAMGRGAARSPEPRPSESGFTRGHDTAS